MNDFDERWRALRTEIAAAAQTVGRNDAEIQVLAVSKTFPASAIQQAYDCGVRRFGENKVQELAQKAPRLPADIEWHLIGHLQSNKAAKALEFAAWIHSVDSLKLLERLDRIAGDMGKHPRILLEVNSGESAKSGVDYADLPELAQAARAAANLDFRGLMTMAPLDENPAVWRAAFDKLRIARDELEQSLGIRLPELSMGMSGDFYQAVQAGATIVRVGSRLFGHRDYTV